MTYAHDDADYHYGDDPTCPENDDPTEEQADEMTADDEAELRAEIEANRHGDILDDEAQVAGEPRNATWSGDFVIFDESQLFTTGRTFDPLGFPRGKDPHVRMHSNAWTPTPEWEGRATMERDGSPLANLSEMGDEDPAKPFLRESWESHVAAMERAGLDPEFIPTWDRWQHSAWGHSAAGGLYRQRRIRDAGPPVGDNPSEPF